MSIGVRNRCFCWAALTLLLVLVQRPVSAFAANRPVGRLWIGTVAIEQYPCLPERDQLTCCRRDARAFVERLRAGGRIPQEQILELRHDHLSSQCHPTRDNILCQLKKFLAAAREEDAVVLFLSLHGVQWKGALDMRPRTFLVPADADPARVPDSLIEMEWLREQLVTGTRARTVLVFLDACHSGGISGFTATPRAAPLSTRSIEALFEGGPPADSQKAIYILTSCSEDQASLECREIGHGIFTYWLLQGLDGAADVNGDAVVAMDELFQFVELQVPLTAAYLSRRTGRSFPQTPCRILCGTDQGDVRLFPLPAQTASRAIEKLSGLIDAMLRNHGHTVCTEGKPARISVLEFGVLAEGGRKELRGTLGSFGAISREHVERRLTDLTGGHVGGPVYQVIPEQVLKTHLRSLELEKVLAGTFPPTTVEGDESIDAMVLGTYLRRGNTAQDPGPDRLQLEIQLFDLRHRARIARISQTLLVNEELWNLLGGSQDERQRVPPVRPVAPTAIPASTSDSQPPTAPAAVQFWNTAAQLDHPLRNPQPATVRITVSQGKADNLKKPVQWLPLNPKDRNQLAFETAPEQELELRVENLTDQWLALIVQIDGVNQIGRRIALPSKSPYWICPPRKTVVVDQWLNAPEANENDQPDRDWQELVGTRLKVVDPPRSLAGQQGYFDQLGEIRVLAYEAREVRGERSASGSTAGLGIGEGVGQSNRFPVIRNWKINPERCLATNVIRYCRAQSDQ